MADTRRKLSRTLPLAQTPQQADRHERLSTAPPVVVTDQAADPGIHIAVVRDYTQLQEINPGSWRAFEVWTKNRVYGLNQHLKCIEVLDRRSGAIDPENKMLGYRLGGGRLRDNNGAHYAYPFPLAGMEGMFSREGRQIFTSRVERCVVRIREVRARGEQQISSWDEILAGRAS